MIVLHEKDLPLKQKTAVAVGLFDGFHAGHLELVRDIERKGLKSAIYTFDIKPGATDLIYTHEEKCAIAGELGVDLYFQREFSEEFSARAPEEFILSLLEDMDMAHITVGFDFRFGRGAAGDTKLLEAMGKEHGFGVSVMPEVQLDGSKVSSSAIRALITAGDMRGAARLLTREYFIEGKIEPGRRIGSSIGFPTANISTAKLLPSYGVYATRAKIDGKYFAAVTNVGTKPTVKRDDTANVETFLLDHSGDLYGSVMRVCFVEKIRDEVRFADVEQLRVQIAKDSESARQILAKEWA